MPINEKGLWTSTTLDERGMAVFGSLDERGQSVFGVSTGGTTTDVTIISVISNATADAINPVLGLDNVIQSIIGSAQADTNIPLVVTDGGIIISSVIATATADAVIPILCTDAILIIPIGSATADASIPNVGSTTDIIINVSNSNIQIDGIAPVISTIRNVIISVIAENAAADDLTPYGGGIGMVELVLTRTNERRQRVYYFGKQYFKPQPSIPITSQNFVINKQLGHSVRITVQNRTSTIPLSGGFYKWTVKDSVSSKNIIEKTGSIDSDLEFTLMPSELTSFSGRYYHEGEIVDEQGNELASFNGMVTI